MKNLDNCTFNRGSTIVAMYANKYTKDVSVNLNTFLLFSNTNVDINQNPENVQEPL